MLARALTPRLEQQQLSRDFKASKVPPKAVPSDLPHRKNNRAQLKPDPDDYLRQSSGPLYGSNQSEGCALAKQRQSRRSARVGNGKGLDPQLLFYLQGLEFGALSRQVSVNK